MVGGYLCWEYDKIFNVQAIPIYKIKIGIQSKKNVGHSLRINLCGIKIHFIIFVAQMYNIKTYNYANGVKIL